MPRGIAADRDTAVRTVTPTRTASRQMNGFVEINTFIHLAPKQKSDQWMHLSPIYTRVHGEWLRYANSTSQFHWRFLLVRDDWGFQVNPLCRHDITRSDRQIGNLSLRRVRIHTGRNGSLIWQNDWRPRSTVVSIGSVKHTHPQSHNTPANEVHERTVHSTEFT